jgi:hypothetical protein
METTTIEPTHDCGMCDGPLGYLGILGRYVWFQCRACGWEHCSYDCCENDLDSESSLAV